MFCIRCDAVRVAEKGTLCPVCVKELSPEPPTPTATLVKLTDCQSSRR